MNKQLMMALAVMSLASAAGMAQDFVGRIVSNPSCHPLMTKKECADYTSSLAALPTGAEREQFLAAHNQTIREREKACACKSGI